MPVNNFLVVKFFSSIRFHRPEPKDQAVVQLRYRWLEVIGKLNPKPGLNVSWPGIVRYQGDRRSPLLPLRCCFYVRIALLASVF
jgi:hypothetical protein